MCVHVLSELTDNEIINPTLIDYGMSCLRDEEEVYWIITHDDFIRVNFLLCYFLKEEPANSFLLCRKDLLNFFLCEAIELYTPCDRNKAVFKTTVSVSFCCC